MDYLTYEVYRYKSRGLYERHKFMFLLMLVLQIDLQQENISQQEFEFIFRGTFRPYASRGYSVAVVFPLFP